MKSAVVHTEKATLSSKGQVVIPKAVRQLLGLHAGNELTFRVLPNKSIEVKPVERSIDMFFGRCKKTGRKPLSIEDMDMAIMKAVSEEDKK